MINFDLAQTLDVFAAYLLGRFCFDGYPHVVHDEIDLDAARQTPIRQRRRAFSVRIEGRELMANPVLEGLAEQLTPGLKLATFS